jgi:histone deacetylase complex regulatory component SIN3
LLGVSEYQKEVSQEFSKVIEDFNKYLKDDILKKKTKPGGGGFRVSTTKSNTQSTISSAPKIANINMNISAGSGGMTFLPMVLPKQSSAPPQIPQMQGKATEVPNISPINFANYWMDVTPELYGIELYV